MEWPKPCADRIYDTFNEFRRRHPWLGAEHIRPKSIARDMYERYASFNDYVREYGLQRSEGLLLRYLGDVYRTLSRTVPDALKTEAFDDVVTFFLTLLRQVDTSLLDEWERLTHPVAKAPETPVATMPVPVDPRVIKRRVRAELHRLLKTLASRAYDEVAACIVSEPGFPWPTETLEKTLAPYFAEHQRMVTEPHARAPALTVIKDSVGVWQATQIIVDPEGHNEWRIQCEVQPEDARAADQPVLIRLRHIGV
jgi:hypothetical protein